MIELYINGRVRDVLTMAPEDIDVTDIARTLSRINRFLGRTNGCEPYSVAQHAVLVSYLCPPDLAYVGLHHDDTEAYLGDLVSPVKQAVTGFRALEDLIWCRSLVTALSLPRIIPEAVHVADKAAFRFEQHHMQGRLDVNPGLHGLHPDFEYAWPWERARREYLDRHRELAPA